MSKNKRVLITVLNWGLGHATRCMPIIDALLASGIQVILASDGRAMQLLQQEYPQLTVLELPPYNPIYPEDDRMVIGMALQLPKFGKAIKDEQERLQDYIDEYAIDAIISDNRYGCYSRAIPSVFITHQLNILMPPHLKWFGPVIKRLNMKYMAKYRECWVPDYPGAKRLSGVLSQSVKGLNCQYVGPLSRLQKLEQQKEYDILAILSGPEPQRSILEEKLSHQLTGLGLKSIVVGGKPEEQQHAGSKGNISYMPLANRQQMNELMAKSEIVIARSGYSTIMDMHAVGGKALFIPTPGQTEQKYLAESLSSDGIAAHQLQEELELEKGISAARKMSGFKGLNQSNELLGPAIEKLINRYLS